MEYFGTTARRLKEFIGKVTCYSWLITALSLVWFLLRSGSNPSRFSYPCQEMARTNIAVFGLPPLYFFLGHFKKYLRFRAKSLRGIFLVGLGLALAWGGGIWVTNYRLVPISPPVREVYGATKSRVVWISDSRATNGYNQPWSNKASQTVVNQMMSDGIKALAGRGTVADSWTAIFQAHNGGRDYASGEKIAIKVNFNNSSDCNNGGCPIPQTVIALLDQLVNAKGIAQENIGLYDVSRTFPSYFSPMILNTFPNVKLDPDEASGCTASENVLGARFGCWLASATYLINMPLLRTHSMAGVTLSLKNHLGSTNQPSAFHSGLLGTNPGSNSLVQLNQHAFIKEKTLLVIAEVHNFHYVSQFL